MIPLSACARTIASGTPFLFLKAVGPYFLVHPRNYTYSTNGITSLSSKIDILYTGLLLNLLHIFLIFRYRSTMHINRLLLLVVDSSDQFQFHLSRDSHIVKVILQTRVHGQNNTFLWSNMAGCEVPELSDHVNRKIMELNGWVSSDPWLVNQ